MGLVGWIQRRSGLQLALFALIALGGAGIAIYIVEGAPDSAAVHTFDNTNTAAAREFYAAGLEAELRRTDDSVRVSVQDTTLSLFFVGCDSMLNEVRDKSRDQLRRFGFRYLRCSYGRVIQVD